MKTWKHSGPCEIWTLPTSVGIVLPKGLEPLIYRLEVYCIIHYAKGVEIVASLGLEPIIPEPKSDVLPLHYEAILNPSNKTIEEGFM